MRTKMPVIFAAFFIAVACSSPAPVQSPGAVNEHLPGQLRGFCRWISQVRPQTLLESKLLKDEPPLPLREALAVADDAIEEAKHIHTIEDQGETFIAIVNSSRNLLHAITGLEIHWSSTDPIPPEEIARPLAELYWSLDTYKMALTFFENFYGGFGGFADQSENFKTLVSIIELLANATKVVTELNRHMVLVSACDPNMPTKNTAEAWRKVAKAYGDMDVDQALALREGIDFLPSGDEPDDLHMLAWSAYRALEIDKASQAFFRYRDACGISCAKDPVYFKELEDAARILIAAKDKKDANSTMARSAALFTLDRLDDARKTCADALMRFPQDARPSVCLAEINMSESINPPQIIRLLKNAGPKYRGQKFYELSVAIYALAAVYKVLPDIASGNTDAIALWNEYGQQITVANKEYAKYDASKAALIDMVLTFYSGMIEAIAKDNVPPLNDQLKSLHKFTFETAKKRPNEKMWAMNAGNTALMATTEKQAFQALEMAKAVVDDDNKKYELVHLALSAIIGHNSKQKFDWLNKWINQFSDDLGTLLNADFAMVQWKLTDDKSKAVVAFDLYSTIASHIKSKDVLLRILNNRAVILHYLDEKDASMGAFIQLQELVAGLQKPDPSISFNLAAMSMLEGGRQLESGNNFMKQLAEDKEMDSKIIRRQARLWAAWTAEKLGDPNEAEKQKALAEAIEDDVVHNLKKTGDQGLNLTGEFNLNLGYESKQSLFVDFGTQSRLWLLIVPKFKNDTNEKPQEGGIQPQ